MNKKLALLIFCPWAALVLELLPFGVVMRFGPSPDEVVYETCSYFSLLPVGYANFGPFLTAIATVLLCVLMLCYLVSRKRIFVQVGKLAAWCGAFTSLLPLLFGIDCATLVGAGVTLALFVEAIFLCSVKRT